MRYEAEIEGISKIRIASCAKCKNYFPYDGGVNIRVESPTNKSDCFTFDLCDECWDKLKEFIMKPFWSKER